MSVPLAGLVRRAALPLAMVMLVGGGPPAHAQVFVEVGPGAAYQSDLVRDSIVQPIHAGLAIAPTVTVAIGTPLSRTKQLAVGLGWSRSDLERREAETVTPILPVTVWSVSVQLRHRLRPGMLARLEVGGVKYAPDPDGRSATIFRDDAPFVPAVTLGARIERRVGSRLALGFDFAYGVHRFTTLALRDDGIGEHRTVHRVQLGVVLRGGNDRTR